MKIYYLNYSTQECGIIEAFASRSAASKRRTEIRQEQRACDDDPEYDQMPDTIHEEEFPITKYGILQAFERGAQLVIK